MHCDTTLLTLYWSGELSEQEARQMETHLAECADCRRELAELNTLSGMVSDMPPVDAPRDFVGAAMEETSAPPVKPVPLFRRPAIIYPAFSAVAMAAAIMLVVMGPWFAPHPVPTVSSVVPRQTMQALYEKASNANRLTSAKRRPLMFRTHAGALAKKVEITKRFAQSRSRTFRITR